MSYDLRIGVKVEGLGKIVEVARPTYDSPTYNLGKMFRACTGWDFKQGEWYNCGDVIGKITDGITNLITDPTYYRKYEPENKFGTVENAVTVLESLRDCIYETTEDVPLLYLWVRW